MVQEASSLEREHLRRFRSSLLCTGTASRPFCNLAALRSFYQESQFPGFLAGTATSHNSCVACSSGTDLSRTCELCWFMPAVLAGRYSFHIHTVKSSRGHIGTALILLLPDKDCDKKDFQGAPMCTNNLNYLKSTNYLSVHATGRKVKVLAEAAGC